MQVRKFEARSMKEAIEMVKKELGPEAIILSAKDNSRSFGLVGDRSFEVTAAVPDDVLQKKRFVESRLKEDVRAKFQQAPAAAQKKVMQKFVDRYTAKTQSEGQINAPELSRNEREEAVEKLKFRSSGTRYVDIHDDDDMPAPTPIQAASIRTAQSSSYNSRASDSSEVVNLKNEIEQLKKTIMSFEQRTTMSSGQHPGASYDLKYEVSHAFEKLIQAGIAEDVTADILAIAQDSMTGPKLKNRALVDAWVARYILDSTNVNTEFIPKNRFQVFVGPTGSGKTSTLVKMASYLKIKAKKRCAIVTTDTYKVGAAEQLKIYASIMGVPFGIIRNRSDWDQLNLGSVDYVFVDMPGLSLKNVDEISMVRSLMPADVDHTDVHLVLSALMKDSDLDEIGKRFKVTRFSDVIFTRIDECVQHGNIYNFCYRTKKPIHSFGIGTRVPEDFEEATKERVLDLIFKLTKMKREISP